jgi:hypothetical protein
MPRDYQFMPTVRGQPLTDALGITGAVTLGGAATLSNKVLDVTTRYGQNLATVTADGTIAAADGIIRATPPAAPITLTLPDPVTATRFTVTNASPQWAVMLRPASGHTINGTAGDVPVLPRGNAELYATSPTTWVTLGPPRIPGTIIGRFTVTATSTASGAAVRFTADYNPLGAAVYDAANPTRLAAPAPGTYRYSGHITHGSITTGTSIGSQVLVSGANASPNAINTTSKAMGLSGSAIKLPHEIVLALTAGAYAEFTVLNGSAAATTPTGLMTIYYA